MTDRFEKAKKWLHAIDGASYDPEMQIKRNIDHLYEVYPISHKFNKILIRMKLDLKHHYESDSQFSFFHRNERGHLVEKAVDVFNPTNHTSIDDKLYGEMIDIIGQAHHIIDFPIEVAARLNPSFSGKVAELIGPKLARSMLNSLGANFRAIDVFLSDSKTLDLREDYPAIDAIRALTREVELTRRDPNIKSR